MKVTVLCASVAVLLAACSDGDLPPLPAGPHTEEQQATLEKAAADILQDRVNPYYLPVRERDSYFNSDRQDPNRGCPSTLYLGLYDRYDPDRPTPSRARKELTQDAEELAEIREWLMTSVTDPAVRQLYLTPLKSMEEENRKDLALTAKWRECSERWEREREREQQQMERARRSLPMPPR